MTERIQIRRCGYPRLFPSDAWLEAQKSIPLKQKVLEFIYFRRAVTFPVLQTRFGDEAGERVDIGLPELNIVFWRDLSKELAKVIVSLEQEGLIKMSGGNFLSLLEYLFDGTILNLPIARQKRRRYVSQRWAPILFNPTLKCRDLVVDIVQEGPR